MKHLEQTLATYVYSHCSICNIPIYFCNTDIKHLQHTSETSETYVCNMRFQRNIFLLHRNGGSLACGVNQWRARGGAELAAPVENRHRGSTRCGSRGEGEAKVAASGVSCHRKRAKPGRQPAARVRVDRATRWSRCDGADAVV